MDTLKLSGEVKLLLPESCKLEEAKVETTIENNMIKSKITYPNGIVIESVQTADSIDMKVNKDLVYNSDGTVSIVL